MKAFIASILIFIVILLGQFFFYRTIVATTDNLTNKVDIVTEFVLQDDWHGANEAIKNLKHELEVHSTFLMSMIQHSETDQIEIAIGNLEAYIEHEDISQATAGINELVFLFKHISDTEALTLKNVL